MNLNDMTKTVRKTGLILEKCKLTMEQSTLFASYYCVQKMFTIAVTNFSYLKVYAEQKQVLLEAHVLLLDPVVLQTISKTS